MNFFYVISLIIKREFAELKSYKEYKRACTQIMCNSDFTNFSAAWSYLKTYKDNHHLNEFIREIKQRIIKDEGFIFSSVDAFYNFVMAYMPDLPVKEIANLHYIMNRNKRIKQLCLVT